MLARASDLAVAGVVRRAAQVHVRDRDLLQRLLLGLLMWEANKESFALTLDGVLAPEQRELLPHQPNIRHQHPSTPFTPLPSAPPVVLIAIVVTFGISGEWPAPST